MASPRAALLLPALAALLAVPVAARAPPRSVGRLGSGRVGGSRAGSPEPGGAAAPCLGCAANRRPSLPAAVVGAGLGGSAVAYFLQQHFGPQVQLDVYEQGGVGGRLATVTVNKQQYESRAASIHALSLHVQDFVKTLGECRVIGGTRRYLGTMGTRCPSAPSPP